MKKIKSAKRNLKNICHFLSFVYARTFMCLLLFLFGFPLRPTSYYAMFGIILIPFFGRVIAGQYENEHKNKEDVLSSLSRHYHYTNAKLCAESISFLLICLLLLLWQKLWGSISHVALLPMSLPMCTLLWGIVFRILAYYVLCGTLHRKIVNGK